MSLLRVMHLEAKAKTGSQKIQDLSPPVGYNIVGKNVSHNPTDKCNIVRAVKCQDRHKVSRYPDNRQVW